MSEVEYMKLKLFPLQATLARSYLFPFSEGFQVISVNMTEYYTII